MREQVINQINEKKLIAIVRGMDEKDILNVANALYQGGISLMEVTFIQNSDQNYSSTLNQIKAIADNMSDKMLVGAGTVLTEKQAELAKESGAAYIVSPNTNAKVIKHARELGMVTIPGAFTATEVVDAYEAGADFVKLFPAGNVGEGYIKALLGPLSHIPLIVVGGVNEKNITNFIKAGACGAGIGGNLIRKDWIKAGKFNEITELSKKYVSLIYGG